MSFETEPRPRCRVEALESRVLLSFGSLGSEFRVNTYTASDQSAPAVASDAAGDSVVTWQSFDQDGSNYGVYAQRYSAAGLAQGGEFQVNSYTQSLQGTPCVAMDSAGDFVITWQSYGEDGSGYGIYAKRYNAAGVEQAPPAGVTRGTGDEFQVNTYTTGAQESPRVAMDSAGDFVITWQSDGEDGSGLGVYAKRYNAAGVEQQPPPGATPGVGNEFQVNTYTTGTQENPSVAMNSSGDFAIAWDSFQDGSYNVYARQYDATGIALGGVFQVNTYATNVQNLPSVAMDSAGDFVVAWQSDGEDGSGLGIYAKRYDSAGLEQTPPAGVTRGAGNEFQVNTYTSGAQSNPRVAMDPAGDFVIAWQSFGEDGSGYAIESRQYDPAGFAPSGERLTNTHTAGNQINPCVAMDSTSDVLAAWQSIQQDGSDYGVYAQWINGIAPSHLVFLQQPGATIAGTAVAPAVTVAVEDDSGNTVTTDNSTVTLTLDSGTLAGDATTISAVAVNGLATFTGLTVDTAGSHTLTAADGSLPPTASSSFTVSPAAAAQLVITNEPSDTIAGNAISPDVTVAVEDQYGNVVSTDGSTVAVTLSSGTFADGSTTETAAAVNGIATFSGLTIDAAGTYTLSASDGTLAGDISSSFTVNPAAPAQLEFTNEPSDTTAGNAISPAVTVAVEDQYGNVVSTDASTIAVTLSSDTFADGSTTETAAAVNGIATFSGLTIDAAGSYTLSAADGTLAGNTSSSFTVSPAAPAQLVITNDPSDTTAGNPISPEVTVAVEDQYGNVVSTDASTIAVTLSSGTFADGSATETVAAVNGVATFSGLTIDTAGSYTLSATDGALAGDTSSSFTVNPSAPAQLVFTNEPSDTTAGDAIAPEVTVAVEDQYNNVVSTDASTIALSLSSGTFADGSTAETAAAVNGVATFSDLTIDAAGSYSLAAADGTLTGDTSSSFTVSPAAPAQLVITNEPSDTTAGNPIAPEVTVAVEDQYGNVVSTDASTVAVTLSSGIFADGSTAETAAAVNGVATFSDLTIDAAGSYTLSAADGTLAGDTSSSFTISPAAPAQLLITNEPSDTAAGDAIAPEVTVAVEDQYGNVVSTDASTVAVTLSSGTFADGGATEAASDVNGVATFNILTIDAAGSYSLAATDGSLTTANSSSFTIGAAAASTLVVTGQPSDATAGNSISPPVTVAVEDQYGNVVPTDSSTVTISVSTGIFADGGTTETAAAVNGVATFAGLTLDTAGSYSLAATDGSLTGTSSSSFTIGAAAATQLVITGQPSNSPAGTAISPAVTVAVEDQYGNVVSSDSSTVTVSLSSGTFADGNTSETAAAVNGIATFSDLTIDATGSYSLTAADGALIGASSSSLTIGAAAANTLVVTNQPSDTTAGSAISPAVTVAVEDRYGNVVPTDSSMVNLSLSAGPFADGSTTETAAALNGVATFSDLAIDATGSYSLPTTDGSLTGANSSLFTIGAAAASQLVFTGKPSNSTAGSAISPAVSVTVEDQYGNVVSTDSSTVTLSLSTGTFADGGTTEAAAAVDGVEAFASLTIDTAGSYSLTATDGSLTSANSSSFTMGPATASNLAFTTEPSDATAGNAISPAVTVAVEDQYGNVVSSDSSTVTVSLSSGTFADGSTTETAAAVSGVATFAGLSINAAGTYGLAATDGSLTGASSSSFTIGAATVSQLVIASQPSDATAGNAISPAVTVAVEDQYGNVVPTDSSTVTLSLSTGTFADGGTTEMAAAVNGVATFNGLTVNSAGNYSLVATDGSLTGAISSSFTIGAAAASQLVVTGQPSDTTIGQAISPTVTVAVEDPFGNVVSSDGSTVTATLSSAAFADGKTAETADAINGVAIFDILTIITPGTYTLAVTDGSLTRATSNTFTVSLF